MRILGLSAFHRDAAAVLLEDGRPVAAAHEERYTKRRLDPAFPSRALRFCLGQGGVIGPELDAVVFYEKPLRKFERLLASQLRGFPHAAAPFAKLMFLWLGDRLWMKNRLAEEVGVPYDRIRFTEHQEAHAASAFFTSPFEEAAVLTIDDGGEWATTSLSRGRAGTLEVLAEHHFPHSLGLFAAALTQFLGFEPGAEQDRVEALSAHGEPRFADALRGLFVDHEDGSFTIDLAPFRFAYDPETLYGKGLERLLGSPRFPGTPLRIAGGDARDADLAASLQVVLEERVLKIAARLHELHASPNLCFAGSLAHNRRLVARLLAAGPFERVHVPSAPEDAGAALGAALWQHHVVGGAPRVAGAGRVDLGEPIDDRAEAGARELGGNGAPLEELRRRLLEGQSVGWTNGPVDFAPESLGHRSILRDARGADGAHELLSRVQLGERWLPCRVAVTAERAAEYFEVPANSDSALRHGRIALRSRDALRAHAPSVAAPDGQCWVQVVAPDDHPELHRLLELVAESTGAPLLLHHTLHLRGAPMARNEADAVDAFQRSTLDALVSGPRLYER
jgi:carbamoyltransferase